MVAKRGARSGERSEQSPKWVPKRSEARSRCRRCGRVSGEALADAVHTLQSVEESARHTIDVDELTHHRRRFDEAMDRAREELAAIERRMDELTGARSPERRAPRPAEWRPPMLRRDPPPPEFGALLSANAPAESPATQIVPSRNHPAPTRPPRELVELRQMLDQVVDTTSAVTDHRTPFARPRAAGHGTWCVCHECTAAPPEPPVSIH